MHTTETARKFVLLGVSSEQAAAFQDAALGRGYELHHYDTLSELGYLGRLREFDAAIVHEDIEPLSGIELAEYLEKLFQSLPVLLLSEKLELGLQEDVSLPTSVINRVTSGLAPLHVLQQVEAALASRAQGI